jgi:membrane associated rhomboid family serine protease
MERLEQTQWTFRPPGKLFTPAVTCIIVLSIAGILLSVFLPSFTKSFLAVSATKVIHGRIWQLVTYPFVTDSPMNFVLSGIMILFIGSIIEREWKTASFVILWLVVSTGCGLIWVIVNLLTGNDFIGAGAAGCSYGLVTILGLIFRGRKFFVFFSAVKSEYIVLILIAAGILMSITFPINLVWISGALFAYLYSKLRLRMICKGYGIGKTTSQKRPGGFVDID